jgi:lipid-binding SYLF domain-containing protein
MKMLKNAVAAVAAALVFGTSLMPAMANDGAKTLSKSVAALKAISAVPKKGIPPALFKNIQGFAIFPGFSKLDSMVSGRAGSGLLLVRESDGKWSSPVFVSLSGGTLGWQIVGDPMDVFLVFKDRKTVDALLKEKLTLGGKNAPIAGPVGTSLKGASKAELQAEINSYVFSQGKCADVTVATAAVQVASAANDAFYGGNKVPAEVIVSGKVDKSSAEVGNLQKLLAEFAARK